MKKQKQIKIYFCPKCKKSELGFVFRLQNIFGLLPRIECKKCGYSSTNFPQIVIEKGKLEKLNKKVSNKEKKRKK